MTKEEALHILDIMYDVAGGQRKGKAMGTFELVIWTLAVCLWGYFWGFRQAKKEEKEANERRNDGTTN